MASHHANDKLRKKVKAKLPQIFVDKDADFASIKIAEGIEQILCEGWLCF